MDVNKYSSLGSRHCFSLHQHVLSISSSTAPHFIVMQIVILIRELNVRTSYDSTQYQGTLFSPGWVTGGSDEEGSLCCELSRPAPGLVYKQVLLRVSSAE